MHICLLIDPLRLRQWHLWLARDLQMQDGHSVGLMASDTKQPLPRACSVLHQFEKTIYRLPGKRASDVLGTDEVRTALEKRPCQNHIDLLINLSGTDAAIPKAKRLLTPLYNQSPHEAAAYLALLDHQPIELELHDSARGPSLLSARPALKEPEVLTGALDNIFSGLGELIIKSVQNPVKKPQSIQPPAPHHASGPALPLPITTYRLLQNLSIKLGHKLHTKLKKREEWAIGWRFLTAGESGLINLKAPNEARYTLLPDDGKRYFADPFALFHQGHYHIFCEEYPYETQKGLLSVFTIKPDGTVSAPRVILEKDCHLSYPFLFEHKGDIWMMPEMGACGKIELYRALSFPDKWVLERTLIDGITAYDATLIQHEGRFWLFFSQGRWQSASWDDLHLYYADDLMGDWTPHPLNPVAHNAQTGRPAGAMFERHGQLLRPVQNGALFYGHAMTLCRVDELTPERFTQTPIGTLQQKGTAKGLGCHTLNQTQGMEVADFLGRGDTATKASLIWTPSTKTDMASQLSTLSNHH